MINRNSELRSNGLLDNKKLSGTHVTEVVDEQEDNI